MPRIIASTHATLQNAAARAAVALLAMTCLSAPASAASISGKWSGSGIVKLSDGGQETVRCQVTYGRIAGQNFSVNARCASGAGRVDQTGQLKRVNENRYVGTVHNKQYNVRANVAITVTGRNQQVSITSSRGSASIQLARR